MSEKWVMAPDGISVWENIPERATAKRVATMDRTSKRAPLVLAAPDLLEALKLLFDESSPFITDADSCECGDSEDGAVCCHMLAFRAIAKAEGGAS